MIDSNDIGLILGILGVMSIIFTIYNYFRTPQIKLEKEQIKAEEDLKDKATILSQKEVENKANVLEKQFQWYMEVNEKKFTDLGERLEKAFLLASNHTNTVDKKVDKLIESSNLMAIEVGKLSTVIEERIPRK